MNIRKVYEQRKLILEGVKNTIFKKDAIEKVAAERLAICKTNKCGSYDVKGDGCLMPGTQPCCDERNGGCGCSLKLAIRSMAKECPKGHWEQVLSKEEEDEVYNEIGYDPEA